jgi:hypothetical protein
MFGFSIVMWMMSRSRNEEKRGIMRSSLFAEQLATWQLTPHFDLAALSEGNLPRCETLILENCKVVDTTI